MSHINLQVSGGKKARLIRAIFGGKKKKKKEGRAGFKRNYFVTVFHYQSGGKGKKKRKKRKKGKEKDSTCNDHVRSTQL